jgi:hypothetical protein
MRGIPGGVRRMGKWPPAPLPTDGLTDAQVAGAAARAGYRRAARRSPSRLRQEHEAATFYGSAKAPNQFEAKPRGRGASVSSHCSAVWGLAFFVALIFVGNLSRIVSRWRVTNARGLLLLSAGSATAPAQAAVVASEHSRSATSGGRTR